MRVDGVKQPVAYYSLDVIISIGYRVKSKRGTAFRIWARQILKDYLIKGYAVNERIRKEQIGELRQAELSLQKAKDLMDKRLETGYEYYQEQSINAMCDALANIKQQDVKLSELGLCEINYI